MWVYSGVSRLVCCENKSVPGFSTPNSFFERSPEKFSMSPVTPQFTPLLCDLCRRIDSKEVRGNCHHYKNGEYNGCTSPLLQEPLQSLHLDAILSGLVNHTIDEVIDGQSLNDR